MPRLSREVPRKNRRRRRYAVYHGMNRSLGIRALAAATLPMILVAAGAPAAGGSVAAHYREGDYAAGHTLSVLPPGENGLVNVAELNAFFNNGTRPPNSNDQLPQYANLLYGLPGLTDSGLSTYFNDESFGVKPSDVTRVEHPDPNTPVTIYRDTRDVPHVYGDTTEAMAFGAGFAAAEDRLFLMDVLRHFGAGNISSFLGASCADERMDHDQLLLAPYTAAQQQAQIDALPSEFGAAGLKIKRMGEAYVAGINRYVAEAQVNTKKRPIEYIAALNSTPQPWTPGDVVAVASLVGGIFGRGGGNELANARLLQYLQNQPQVSDPGQVFTSLKEQNDPNAPTTITDRTFPYEIPGQINPSLTALPDNANAPLIGGPTDTTPGCTWRPRQPHRGPGRLGPPLVAQGHEQRPGRRRPSLGFGTPDRGLRPPGLVFRAPNPHAGGPARARLRGRGRRLPWHQPRGRARAGPGLRLVGDISGDRPDRPAPGSDLRPGRWQSPAGGPLLSDRRALPAHAAPRIHRDGAEHDRPPRHLLDDSRRRAGVDDCGRRASRGRGQSAQHLPARARQLGRVLRLRIAGHDPQRHFVDEVGRPGAVHLQLVLRRRPRHRVLRQRARSDPAAHGEPQPPDMGHRRGRVAGFPQRGRPSP